MKLKIDNITWTFEPYNDYDIDDSLGLAYVGIPPNMLKRFIKECCWDDNNKKLPPHYFDGDEEYIIPGDEHECYNSDTQIVLMKWLGEKQRKYELSYRGSDPFWIFHDNRHSRWDVYGYEVGGITSYTEYQRILEGAEMAKHHGIFIQPQTVAGILKDWNSRFNREGTSKHSISEFDFKPLMKNTRAFNQIHYYE